MNLLRATNKTVLVSMKKDECQRGVVKNNGHVGEVGAKSCSYIVRIFRASGYRYVMLRFVGLEFSGSYTCAPAHFGLSEIHRSERSPTTVFVVHD